MDQHPARGPAPSALIINDGTLGALVACWAEGVVRPQSGRAAPLIWFPLDDKPAREARRDAAARQVELCSLAGLSDRQLIRYDSPPPPHAHIPEGVACAAKSTATVLAAAVEAAALGIDRVIWPVHVGTNHDVAIEPLADVCDRAMLIAQLMGLGSGVCCSHERRAASTAPAISIHTPYADLTDAQLMDLALDMDVPLSACWWCLNEDPTPCGHCAGCMRWHEALAAVDPAGWLNIQTLATDRGRVPSSPHRI